MEKMIAFCGIRCADFLWQLHSLGWLAANTELLKRRIKLFDQGGVKC
jgi:hypothetical protein